MRILTTETLACEKDWFLAQMSHIEANKDKFDKEMFEQSNGLSLNYLVEDSPGKLRQLAVDEGKRTGKGENVAVIRPPRFYAEA